MEIEVKHICLGKHYWPECLLQEVNFLRNYHSHHFIITAATAIETSRGVEFISAELLLMDVLEDLYPKHHHIHDFQDRSCEQIAAEIEEKLGVEWRVSVSEDGWYRGGRF